MNGGMSEEMNGETSEGMNGGMSEGTNGEVTERMIEEMSGKREEATVTAIASATTETDLLAAIIQILIATTDGKESGEGGTDINLSINLLIYLLTKLDE